MRITALGLAAVLPLSVLGALAATPDNGTDCRDFDGTSQICRTQVYLECNTTVPMVLVAPPIVDPNPTWGYDAPSGAMTSGSGCGQYDDGAFRNTTQDGLYSFDMGGVVAGDLDEMTVELHNLDAGAARSGAAVNVNVRVTIDGKSPFGGETVENVQGEPTQSPTMITVPVVPVDMGATTLYRFTIAGLAASLNTIHPEKDDRNRQVLITIDVPLGAGSAGFNPWIWGASDAATGVTFNGLEDEEKGTIVEAIPAEELNAED